MEYAVLITLIGLKGALMMVALLNLLAAGVAYYLNSGSRKRLRMATVALASIGLYLVSMRIDVVFTKRITKQGIEVMFHQEDATGVVEVWRKDGQRFLMTNRLHTEGSDIPDEIYKMRKQGYLPLLLHPHPVSVIEIGLGAGFGFIPVILHDRVKDAEMVELSPGVVRAASFLMKANQPVLQHPKLTLRVDDGRNYLLVTAKRYDLIILGLFTPYRWGTGYLYTRELYGQARNRLKDGGMVVQWLALSQLSLRNLKIVLNTFRSVFPHVYVWDKGYFLGLVAMDAPLQIDFQRFQDAFQAASIQHDLKRWGLDDPYNFLASFLMGSEEVEGFSPGAPLNTEDRLRIEFSHLNVFRAAYSLDYAAENLRTLLRHRTAPSDHITNLREPDRDTLKRYLKARKYALQGLVYEAKGLHEPAYKAFSQAESLNHRDDIASFAMKKYRK